jgi:CHAT domain-containing protein
VRGNLSQAQDEAETCYEYYAGGGSDWAWKFRILKARILNWRGMNNDALRTLAFELPPSLKNTDLDIQKQELEGLTKAHLHNFAEAQEVLSRAAHDSTALDSPMKSEVLTAQGLLLMEKGEYAKAQEQFRASLESARQRNDQFVEAMASLNLSYVELQQEHWDQAIDWSETTYKTGASIGARLVMERALGNRGWANYKIGDLDQALALFSGAERQATELGSEIDQVRWLTTAGYVYMDAGELSVAENNYQKALDLARKINAKENISDALVSLAFVTVQTGQLDLAKKYSDEAISMARADGNRVDELYPLLASGQIAARQHDSSQAERTFLEVANDPKVDPSLKWEAQHELANLYADENRTSDADKAYRTTLETFEAARSSLQHEDVRLPFLANASSLYDDYIHLLVTQEKTADALQLADYSRSRTLAEGLGVLSQQRSLTNNFDPRGTAKQVGGTILFYWLGPKQSYLWAVTPEKINLFRLPPAAEIEESVQRYRKALVAGRDPLESANPEGSKLFDMLAGPAKQSIPSNSRVVIIPDGSLNNLNFETLLVSEPKLHYWIEDVTISNATSIRLLAASQSKPRAGAGKLLLIGDAVSPDAQYGDLPKAAVEMQDIEKHFASAEQEVYQRDHATPVAYLTGHPEQFSYIHFVAHGTASRLSPLDSAVVLSKASAEEDSYKLYARDIIQRPLHAKLVTISTCYGAGARAYTGEGLVGLSWAFLRAGAHNVIGALWEVSDASTPGLMDELYGQLKRGQSPEAALRAAKLSLLHTDGVFRKPFYWAPFQLYTGS